MVFYMPLRGAFCLTTRGTRNAYACAKTLKTSTKTRIKEL